MERFWTPAEAAVHTYGEFCVEALTELDALVGRHVTREAPRIHWEDSRALLRFDSRDEAIEAIRHPSFRRFVPDADWETSAVKEVRTFRPYSTNLAVAWEVVTRLAHSQAFHLSREPAGRHWTACFDGLHEGWHRSAPVAICLAALRSRGIEVVIGRALAR